MLGMITVVNSTPLFLYEYIIRYLIIGVKLWVAFFISFTIPRLYSCYSIQMNQKGNPVHQYVLGLCGLPLYSCDSKASANWLCS